MTDEQWIEHEYGKFCIKFSFTIERGICGTDNREYPFIDIHFACVTSQIVEFGGIELEVKCDLKHQSKEFRQHLIDVLNQSFMEEIEKRNLLGG